MSKQAQAASPSMVLYERSPKRAFAALSDEQKVQWQARYCGETGASATKVWALLVATEGEMKSLKLPRTIHALWVFLADKAGQGTDPDLNAAAALAGIAMNLVPA